MANLSAPGQSPEDTQLASADPAGHSMADAMTAQHDHTSGVFDKMQQAKQTLEKVRGAIDKLVPLGDQVTADDAIGMGGALVGAGLAPQAVAGLMADMPQGGEALAQWVQQHADDLAQREQALDAAHAATMHHMGSAALRSIAAQDDEHQQEQAGASAPNALGAN